MTSLGVIIFEGYQLITLYHRSLFFFTGAGQDGLLSPGQFIQLFSHLVRFNKGAQSIEDLQGFGQVLPGLRDVAFLLVEPPITRVRQRQLIFRFDLFWMNL